MTRKFNDLKVIECRLLRELKAFQKLKVYFCIGMLWKLLGVCKWWWSFLVNLENFWKASGELLSFQRKLLLLDLDKTSLSNSFSTENPFAFHPQSVVNWFTSHYHKEIKKPFHKSTELFYHWNRFFISPLNKKPHQIRSFIWVFVPRFTVKTK